MTTPKKTAGKPAGFQMADIWLSFAICFMLFLYAPLELLFTNQDEFWFDAYVLTPLMLVAFGVFFVCAIFLFVLFRKLHEKLYWFGMAAGFAGYIGLYIQGNFLISGLPPLDGERVDWSLYPEERVKSAVVWAVAAAVVAMLFLKLKREVFARVVRTVSIGVTLVLCVTLVTLALTNQGFEKKPSMSVTTENMFEMSRDTNFVILLLDAVDAQVLEDMMETEPRYQDIFTDFTFYDNMVGTYPCTKHSIPYILSGKWFENETTFKVYQREAYASSPFLETMEAAGYRLGVYETDMLLDNGGVERFENLQPNERGAGDKWAFVRWQFLMTGFKYAPYDLKQFSFVNPNAFSTLKIPPEGKELFTGSNLDFYDGLRHQELKLTDQKCFRFIHVDGGHVPFIYNERMEIIPEKAGSYENNLKACLTITRAYLDKLKSGGAYDNSVIIVMADHGYNWGDYHGRQNPAFFVKGMNEKHDFAVSDAPVSFVDLQEAYQRLLNGADGGSIFDWQSGEQRERRYLFYEYSEENYMTEFIQPGQAHDTEAMYETGEIYAR